MALGVPPTAYDRAAIIFSPEGDLYQVRYAFEAVKKGWTSIGVRGKDAVVLAAEKRRLSPLLDLDSIDKIYKVDDHVGVVFAGMGSDGRVLIDYARLVAVRHRLLYGEAATVDYLAKQIADLKQVYTQHGGVRPFGVALIFGGINPDGTPRLIRTDPGGQYFSYYAVAIGMGDAHVNEFFEREYRKDLSLDDMVKLVLTAIVKSRARGGDEKPEELVKDLHNLVEIGYITVEDRTFKMMDPGRVKEYVDEIKDKLLG
ncbi:MAG: archaeal proteasome endopeptidase complex subunit alpha [Desulfurococcales archaeon]|nr:archaeal proteasome endopeptidase complex subunit alpha [Desulfurococcales archaeon]MCE4605552.1 archaeal proteasome endopeptidase complex subunit alpha [Desulfurococcales archaeon]